MKICVLQPLYDESDLNYKNYDPPRNLSHLILEASFHYEFLKKSTVYKQLKKLKKENFDIYVNLCEGYLDWDTPSIDVIYSLELLNLPYTGTSFNLYDPSKELMKYVAYTVDVPTQNYVIVKNEDEILNIEKVLKYPLFIKPGHAGDSLGIDKNSLVYTKEELLFKAKSLIQEYDSVLIEEYIDGREFSVLVVSNSKDQFNPLIFCPVEFIFPEGESFKTYKLKTTEYHPESNIPCKDLNLSQKLKNFAKSIFLGFEAVGYARMDFRLDQNMNLYFLEVNFACSIFYPEGFYGTADYILNFDGFGHANFLKHIIQEGIDRHRTKQPKYYIKKNAVSGYGIFAVDKIKKDEVIFIGEERSQRIASKNHIEKNWKHESQMNNYKNYAYPIGSDAFILWDEKPENWSPQNHSCSPNTEFVGLNIVAIRDIEKNEELTIDYSTFVNPEMEPFKCTCNAANCKKIIKV